MRIGIVTDELSLDFEAACEIARLWGIRDIEIRSLWGKRVPDLTEDEIREVVRVIKLSDLRVTAISPGIFKIPFDPSLIEEHKGRRLEASFRLAERLGTMKIIIFGIQRSPGEAEAVHERVTEVLSEASQKAEREGFILALENEAGCWCDTAKNTLRAVRAVDSSALRVNWDPGNAFVAGDLPYPDGYRLVRDHVINLHVKDALREAATGRWRFVPLGEGEIEWVGQLREVAGEGRLEHVTLETHLSPRVTASRKCYERLKEILG